MITQHFVLHIVPDEVRPRIHLSQRSSGLEKLQFTLVGTDGNYYTIPTGTTVTFVGSKPDKKAFSYACTWSGNTVNVDVTEQITAVAGLVEAELRFENDSGALLPSQNMVLVVERSPLDGTICSRSDFASVDEEIISIHQESVLAKEYAVKAAEYSNKTAQAMANAESIINETTAKGEKAIDEATDKAVEKINELSKIDVNFYYTQSSGTFEITKT